MSESELRPPTEGQKLELWTVGGYTLDVGVARIRVARSKTVQGGEVHAVQALFLVLLLFVVIFAALARKLETPYPIVLVIAGLLLSFIPGTPRIDLNPNVIFLVVLPPLLYSAAWLTSWREFKHNLVSILLLAFGLVGFTVTEWRGRRTGCSPDSIGG